MHRFSENGLTKLAQVRDFETVSGKLREMGIEGTVTRSPDLV